MKQSASSGGKNHWLLVGPRGIGKTHLVSLVYHRLRRRGPTRKNLVIAWLREDSWEVASYLDFLEAVIRAVHADPLNPVEADGGELLPTKGAAAERHAEDELMRLVGGRTVLLIVENLDEVFAGLGAPGQRSLRALIENTDQFVMLATIRRFSRVSPDMRRLSTASSRSST